eukprot:2240917-Alexandrium_andersonii.AAC.1
MTCRLARRGPVACLCDRWACTRSDDVVGSGAGCLRMLCRVVHYDVPASHTARVGDRQLPVDNC